MQFVIATPESSKTLLNTTKVRVHLRSGVAEVFENHQDLMGKIDANLVQTETVIDNRVEKATFIVQDAVFIVSTKGLDATTEVKGTSVYVYSNRIIEVNSALSLDTIKTSLEQKTEQLDAENLKLVENSKNRAIASKILLLSNEVEFWKRVIIILEDLKKS